MKRVNSSYKIQIIKKIPLFNSKPNLKFEAQIRLKNEKTGNTFNQIENSAEDYQKSEIVVVEAGSSISKIAEP